MFLKISVCMISVNLVKSFDKSKGTQAPLLAKWKQLSSNSNCTAIHLTCSLSSRNSLAAIIQFHKFASFILLFSTTKRAFPSAHPREREKNADQLDLRTNQINQLKSTTESVDDGGLNLAQLKVQRTTGHVIFPGILPSAPSFYDHVSTTLWRLSFIFMVAL